METWLLMTMAATILATPTIHAPLKFMDGYILPQMGMGAIGIALSVIVCSLAPRLPMNPTAWLAILLFIYLMVTTGWSTVSHSSARDYPLIFLSIFGFVIATILFENPANMVLISLAVFFISNLLALYAIGQRFCFDPFFPERLISQKEHYEGKSKDVVPGCFWNKHFQDSRAISTIGNTNFATGYFLSALPFLIYLAFEVSSWFVLSLLPIIGAIVAAECRAGLLGLIVGSLFFLTMLSMSGLPADWIIWIQDSNTRQSWALIGLIWLISGLGVLGWRVTLSDRYKRIRAMLGDENDKLNTMLDIEGKADNSLEDRNHWISHLRYRFRYWRAAWYLIKKRPLTGWGLRTYRREVYQAQGDLNLKDPRFLGPAYQTPQPRECHNDFLENFVEGGFPGGLLFLVILGFVIYHAHQYAIVQTDPVQFLMIGAVLAGLMAFLVDVFFFFPLRLASSALLFWISLALIEGITGQVTIIQLPSNLLISIFIIAGLAAMLYETVWRPNLGNYYFSMYNFSTKPYKKEIFLNKALEACPRETIFRIHMMIGYLNTYLDEASQHIEVARQHFDGMIPAWAMDFNSSIVAFRMKCYEAAMRHIQKSLFYLPGFGDSQNLFQQLWPKAPFQRRRIGMKQISSESLAKLQTLQAQMQTLQNQLQHCDISTHAVILAEKVRLAIPPDWFYNGEGNCFLPPDAVPAGKKVVNVGPANLPILVPENAQVIQR